MSATNIEKFDEITSEVFAKLYRNFPIPCLLKAGDYVTTPLEFHEQLGLELPTKDAEFFFACIRWLESAGYITTESENELYVANALLTSKGLEVLRAVPSSLQGKASIGERLSGGVANGGKELARMLVSEALGLGARIASQHVGLG